MAIIKLPKSVADEKGMHIVLQVEPTLTINTDMTEKQNGLMIPKLYTMKGVGKTLGLFKLLAPSNICSGSEKRNRRKHTIHIP